jgi:glycosyltransferase involved in cell wall biosynthesis
VKQLLAISWEMPPLSGPRAVQVTRTLTALGPLGWHSRVVCFGPRSDRYQQDYRVPVEQLSQGAVTRLPVGSPEEWFLVRALWRLCPPLKHQPDEKRVWLPGALAEARRALAAAPADVLVSFAQPWTDHLVALHLHRETGLPWVAHFSDPWVDSPYFTTNAWARRTASAHESAVVHEATRLVFVNRYTRDRVMAKYPATLMDKARVVPQGFEFGEATRSTHTGAGLRLVYTGRFYGGVRTPDTFLEALATLHRARSLEGRLLVEFVGGDMTEYQRRATALQLDNVVSFAGRVDPATARAKAAGADALLIIDAPSDGPSLFLPSKLVDYLPLRKPVLGVTPPQGPSADLLTALGYPVVDPRDVAAIAAAVERLVEAHNSGGLSASPQHDEVSRTFDILETTRAFAAILDEARQQR